MLRIARFLIAYGVVSVLGVAVSLFLAQNTQVERLTFFGQDVSTSMAWIMLAATAAGFLFALLLLLPGRVAATLHIWSLRKETRQLDEELVWQSERHDELLDHHERLLSGHEWLLSVYRRTRGELDQAISERDVLKVHLAKANDALATQKKVVVQREIIIPAPVRQTSESTPTAPRIRVAPKIPAKVPAMIPAAVARDATEETQEEKPAKSSAAPVRTTPASEPLSAPLEKSIQQAQAALTPGDTQSDESWLVHSGEPSRAIFGAAMASRMRSVTSSLDSWRLEVWSSAQRLYAQGAQRIDHAIIQVRQFGSVTWTRLKERLGGVSGRTEERKRVSPLTHPK
jgi:hypothetical protein